jgi:hypothetical protein
VFMLKETGSIHAPPGRRRSSSVRAPIYRQFAGPMQSRERDRALARAPRMRPFSFRCIWRA